MERLQNGVGGHSFVLFTDLSDIYTYFILLFIVYQPIILVNKDYHYTRFKLGCHVFAFDFQRNSFGLIHAHA